MASTATRIRDQLLLVIDGAATFVDLDPDEAAELVDLLERDLGFEGWADVELMGHRRRIAYVKPIELAHRGFLELTWTVGSGSFREIYSPTAVFCMTPLDDEEHAKRVRDGSFVNDDDPDEIPF